MTRVASFPPVLGPSPRLLILGSMPGRASLEAGQYYAHTRNSFWSILGEVLGFDPAAPYETRLDALIASRIALWDVLHSCVRPGSADSAIEPGTRVPNAIAALIAEHPTIELVCFNGAEAEKSFRRYVLPELDASAIRLLRLPSTSPAYAVLSFEQKLAAWRAALDVQD